MKGGVLSHTATGIPLVTVVKGGALLHIATGVPLVTVVKVGSLSVTMSVFVSECIRIRLNYLLA